jgi:adenylate cyclase
MDLQFGPYRLKRSERLLLGPDGPVELSARSFDILVALLARPDGVVGKGDLLDAAWPGLVVEENTLHVHMSALRKALAPGLIKTVHGRGYQYAGPPARELEPEGSAQVASHSAAPQAMPAGHKPVIAVLPFANLSGDPAQDYFGDGLTEDVIVELSRYRPLTVLARTSTLAFKGAAVDLKEAGRQLGAHYLVEGSVRKAGGRIRVTAQLIEAATASHVWAERYDRELTDAFSAQDELVRRLVSTITGHVEKHTDSRAQTKVTDSLDAYDLWLRALFGGDMWTLAGNAACRRLLEEAIRKDPHFARAHASLAFCNIRDGHLMPGSPEIPSLEQAAVRYAEHAVHLDAAEARAHHALGWSRMYLHEFDRARSSFLVSASLNPNDGSTCIDRALGLALLGEQEAADAAAALAAILNPLGSEYFYHVRAIVHVMGRRHEAAEECFALAPRNWADLLAWRASNLTRLGRHDEAADAMAQALETFALLWRGPAPARPGDFMDWFRHTNMLRRDEDWTYLSEAFPKGSLPTLEHSH